MLFFPKKESKCVSCGLIIHEGVKTCPHCNYLHSDSELEKSWKGSNQQLLTSKAYGVAIGVIVLVVLALVSQYA